MIFKGGSNSNPIKCIRTKAYLPGAKIHSNQAKFNPFSIIRLGKHHYLIKEAHKS